MNSIQKVSLIYLLFVASAILAAPTTDEATTTPAGQVTTVASDLSPFTTTTTTTTTITASTPTSSVNSTNLHEELHAVLKTSSSFSCFNRSIGYYADVERDCKVYHFCLTGDYSGETVHQRITYLCLNDTLFDQKSLDCIEQSKVKLVCKDSESLYEESNAALRGAIVSNQMHHGKEISDANTVSVTPTITTTTTISA